MESNFYPILSTKSELECNTVWKLSKTDKGTDFYLISSEDYLELNEEMMEFKKTDKERAEQLYEETFDSIEQRDSRVIAFMDLFSEQIHHSREKEGKFGDYHSILESYPESEDIHVLLSPEKNLGKFHLELYLFPKEAQPQVLSQELLEEGLSVFTMLGETAQQDPIITENFYLGFDSLCAGVKTNQLHFELVDFKHNFKSIKKSCGGFIGYNEDLIYDPIFDNDFNKIKVHYFLPILNKRQNKIFEREVFIYGMKNNPKIDIYELEDQKNILHIIPRIKNELNAYENSLKILTVLVSKLVTQFYANKVPFNLVFFQGVLGVIQCLVIAREDDFYFRGWLDVCGIVREYTKGQNYSQIVDGKQKISDKRFKVQYGNNEVFGNGKMEIIKTCFQQFIGGLRDIQQFKDIIEAGYNIEKCQSQNLV